MLVETGLDWLASFLGVEVGVKESSCCGVLNIIGPSSVVICEKSGLISSLVIVVLGNKLFARRQKGE